jgi:hypothetical protein
MKACEKENSIFFLKEKKVYEGQNLETLPQRQNPIKFSIL